MTTDAVVATPTRSPSQERRSGAEPAIARRAFQQVWIGATTWAVVFGGTVAASALTYVSSFPDEASRQQIVATTSRSPGMATLFGPVSSIGTVGGYTVYKCFVFLTTIGAIWGLLAATKLLRGEEDAGRWQLVLAGPTGAARATAATMAALGAAVGVLFAGTAVLTMLAARNPDVGFSTGGTIFYGSSLAVAPLVFGAVGALTSQLARTRRLANGLAMGVFGVAFVLRMIADSGPGTRWLLWSTPFGWVERMRPLTDNDPRPLVLAAVTVVALVLATTALASRRDVGAGLLTSRDVAPPRWFGLQSPLGLAVRLEAPVLAAWCAGAAASAFALGIVAKVATGAPPSSISDTLEKFGVRGDLVNRYFGVEFLLVATVVALLPASQLAAASEEETSGRLLHVLAQPIDRALLLTGRLALAGTAVVLAGSLAGIAAWLGARTQGVHTRFASMLGAGLNVVPTALLALGIGAVVLAVAPRVASRAVYGVVIWSLIIDLVASLISGLRWLDRLSLFHAMALVPAQAADPMTMVITFVLAVVLCVMATVLFARRDVHGG